MIAFSCTVMFGGGISIEISVAVLVAHQWYWPSFKKRYHYTSQGFKIYCLYVVSPLIRRLNVKLQNKRFKSW